jgi:2-polyprenyl-3-methyl-5-hydroxy-6-metoxy-1,4-benzoquinol methylase
MDIIKHNKTAWDNYVDQKDRWKIPVSDQESENAKNGYCNIFLTPKKTIPHNWFTDLKGLKILGLASGGGQQVTILEALGADVTIFDNSEKQLQQDKTLSDKFELDIKTVQGDIKDLSVFADNSFELIFNPCSILFDETIYQFGKRVSRY